MRDHPNDRLRLDELIEELTEVRREHGDLYTNIRVSDFKFAQDPKTLRITPKS